DRRPEFAKPVGVEADFSDVLRGQIVDHVAAPLVVARPSQRFHALVYVVPAGLHRELLTKTFVECLDTEGSPGHPKLLECGQFIAVLECDWIAFDGDDRVRRHAESLVEHRKDSLDMLGIEQERRSSAKVHIYDWRPVVKLFL